MLEGLTPPPKFSGNCKVATIANGLEEKDKEIFMAAIDDSEAWGVKTLTKALSERGISISDSPIYNHRGKTCACYRVK
jgi:hypothetical protein